MLNIHFQELNTPRLTLRRLTMEDLPLYYERLGSSETVTRHMLWKPHTCIDESVASIQKAIHRYETGESCRWAIAVKQSNEMAGIIDLIPVDSEKGICTFAYMLGQDFWGKGFGTEAVKAVLDYAFARCGAEEVTADHFAENTASGAVMKKAGMLLQDIIPQKYEKGGRFHDAHQYRITRTQWLVNQSR